MNTETIIEAAPESKSKKSPAFPWGPYAKLRKIAPKVFGNPPKRSMFFVPLKIGIDLDIAKVGPPYKMFECAPMLDRILRHHTSSPRYLATLVAGAIRYDLNGEPAGVVVEEAAVVAANRLAKIRHERKIVRDAAELTKALAIRAARRVLVEKFPKCFTSGRDKVPLKRDIIRDIEKRMSPEEFAAHPFNLALLDYCDGPTYRENKIDFAPMIDLDGKTVAHIGDWQRKNQSAPKAVTPAKSPSQKSEGGHHAPVKSQSQKCAEISATLGSEAPRYRREEGSRKAPIVVVKKRRPLVAGEKSRRVPAIQLGTRY